MTIKTKIPVIEFANMIGKLFNEMPYNNHSITPIKRTEYMVIDMSSTDFDFQVLYTCGTNAAVVKIAAINPIIS